MVALVHDEHAIEAARLGHVVADAEQRGVAPVLAHERQQRRARRRDRARGTARRARPAGRPGRSSARARRTRCPSPPETSAAAFAERRLQALRQLLDQVLQVGGGDGEAGGASRVRAGCRTAGSRAAIGSRAAPPGRPRPSTRRSAAAPAPSSGRPSTSTRVRRTALPAEQQPDQRRLAGAGRADDRHVTARPGCRRRCRAAAAGRRPGPRRPAARSRRRRRVPVGGLDAGAGPRQRRRATARAPSRRSITLREAGYCRTIDAMLVAERRDAQRPVEQQESSSHRRRARGAPTAASRPCRSRSIACSGSDGHGGTKQLDAACASTRAARARAHGAPPARRRGCESAPGRAARRSSSGRARRHASACASPARRATAARTAVLPPCTTASEERERSAGRIDPDDARGRRDQLGERPQRTGPPAAATAARPRGCGPARRCPRSAGCGSSDRRGVAPVRRSRSRRPTSRRRPAASSDAAKGSSRATTTAVKARSAASAPRRCSRRPRALGDVEERRGTAAPPAPPPRRRRPRRRGRSAARAPRSARTSRSELPDRARRPLVYGSGDGLCERSAAPRRQPPGGGRGTGPARRRPP